MSTTNNASAADALAALTAGLTEEKIKAMLEVIIGLPQSIYLSIAL